MKINVFDLTGKKLEAWDIAEKKLGEASEALLAQALRVYESNAHQKTHKVKTRGEVVGSTRKIYRQKGTGNARHGAKYAPIFVGGGIAHGPTGVRPENMLLPKRMRRKALSVALREKLAQSEITGFTGELKVDGKTSSAAKFLAVAAGHPNTSVLVVTDVKAEGLFQMVMNLQGVTMKRAALVNAYDLISHDHVVITKSALDAIIERSAL
jgi:large subunit ribosomal protein L4